MDVLLFTFLMSYSPPGWLIICVNLTFGKARWPLRDGIFPSWKSDVGEQQCGLPNPAWACVFNLTPPMAPLRGTFSGDEIVVAI